MRSSIILAGMAAILPVLAEELGAADVPAACKTICDPIVTLTSICDVDPNKGDANDNKRRGLHFRAEDESDEPIEATCICTNKSFDVASVMALCAGCLAQNGGETEDADKIMSQCSFTSTSYVPSATAQVIGIKVQATKPAVPTSSTSTNTSGASRMLIPGIAVLGGGLMALML